MQGHVVDAAQKVGARAVGAAEAFHRWLVADGGEQREGLARAGQGARQDVGLGQDRLHVLRVGGDGLVKGGQRFEHPRAHLFHLGGHADRGGVVWFGVARGRFGFDEDLDRRFDPL